jgi:FMN reductase
MSILTIAGSPSATSRSARLLDWVGERLQQAGERVDQLAVRELPADDLIGARSSAPAIRAALDRVAGAQAVVIATPVYKAAYSGVLKVFLDLLPQYGLAGKVVLPLATGGSLVHALAIDYALRPVLAALDARVVLPGVFVEERLIDSGDDGRLQLATAAEVRLADALVRLQQALPGGRGVAVTTAPELAVAD